MEMPVAIQIIGVIAALLILVIGAIRGKKLFLLVIISAIIVALTNNTGIWTTFSDTFITGLQSAIKSFFLLVVSATFYSVMMNRTGSTNSIAYWCIRSFGKKNIVIVLMAITGILGLAGLNGMMQVFAVYGIFLIIFKEANLPLELAPGFIFFGCGMFAEGFFPASVHMNNVIPTQFLGTTLMAGPGLGLITGCICIVLSYFYFNKQAKTLAANGIGYSEPKGSYVSPAYGEFNESNVPSIGRALLPMVIMIILVFVLNELGVASGKIAVVAMISAGIVCGLINIPTLKSQSFTAGEFLQDVYNQTWHSCGPLAMLIAFGTVVSTSPGYQAILNWVMGLDISTYIKGVISVGVLSAATGSSATGLNLTGSYLGEYFVNSGVNLGILHRLMAMSSAVFCEVPHCSAIYLIVGMFGVTYKKGYKHVCAVTVVIGSIALAIGLIGVLVLGL